MVNGDWFLVNGRRQPYHVRGAEATVRAVFESTAQLHDGRWLWIPVRTAEDAQSVKVLLRAKRKPEKTGEG